MILIVCGSSTFAWPRDVPARLIRGLEECGEGEHEVDLSSFLDTEARFQLFRALVKRPCFFLAQYVRIPTSDREACLSQCQQALDYLGCWTRTEILWDASPWTRSIVRLSTSPSPAEVAAWPPFSLDNIPRLPWGRGGTILDPHEDWNILHFLARPHPKDLFPLPGLGLTSLRPVFAPPPGPHHG